MDNADALAARLRANPADHEAYQALKTLYFHQGDFGSLANLIAGWAGWVPDDHSASRAYVEVADVLVQHLGDHAQAESCYLEALRRDPLNAAASESLQALWEAAGEHAKIAELLQHELETLPQHGAPSSQLALTRYRMGELWSKALASNAEAIAHYRKAFELDPTLVRALYEARQLFLQDRDLRAAAELCEREAAAEPDLERKLALYGELAALCRDELGDLDAAVSALERAHELVPEDAALAYDLTALLVQRAAGADERTARGDRTRAADLLTAIAATLEGDQAVSYLESALGYAPAHEAALSALERQLESSGRELQLAGHWVAYLAAVKDGRAAHRRRVKLARAYAQQGQIDDAIYCLEPAAQAGFAGATELYDQLTSQARREPFAHEEPTAPPPRSYRQRDRGERPQVGGGATRPTRPPALRETTDLGDIKTHVGEPDVIESLREATAEVALERAEDDEERSEKRALDPAPARGDGAAPALRGGATSGGNGWSGAAHGVPAQDPTAHLELADLEEFEEVADPNEETAEGMKRPSQRAGGSAAPARPPPLLALDRADRAQVDVEVAPEAEPVREPAPAAAELRDLRRTAAALAREHRQDEAASVFEEILRGDPLDREAFAYLDGYYRRKQHHRERAQLLEQSAGSEQLPLRLRIARLREAASTYEARLKEYAAAIRCFELLARLDTETDDAQRALKRLLERTGRWDELASLYEGEISRAPQADGKLPLLRKLAQLHRERRNDRAAAADALERTLMLKPDDRALRDALIDDLLALGRFEDALPWLERKIDEAATRPQKLALLQQLAQLCLDQLRDPNRAFAVFERILALSPGDAATLERMAEMDERAGNYPRMLATLERQVAQAAGAQAAPVLARMAEIAETKLNDSERASELLSRAVDAAPERAEYLQALCALYEREERYDDLVELLRERVLIERNAGAKIELYRRIALTLRERLQDPEGAYEAWEQLLHVGEDREALLALQQRALERDDSGALVELLGRLAAIELDPQEQRDLLFDRARLLGARLGRPADAIPDLLRILLEVDPDFELAWGELAAASEAAGDYNGFARVLEQRLGRAQAPEQQAELARGLADVYEGKLADPERAIGALARWAAADPRNAEPHRRLSPLLTRARRYADLVGTLDALARIDDDPDARVRAAITAADLCQRRLSDPEGAWRRLVPLVESGVADAVKAAIALAQSTKRIDALYELLERAGQYERLLSLLRERAAREQEPRVRAWLLRKSAQILIDYAQDEDGAADAYRRLLELEEDPDALRFMQALAVRRDDPQLLAEMLGRLAALEADAAQRRDLLIEQARLLRERLARPADAVAVLQRLLAEHPGHDAVLGELMRAAEAAADHKTLAATLEHLLARARTSDGRIELAERLADVCERDLGDAPRAIAALQQWAAAAPDAPQPQRRLRPLLAAAGRDRDLLVTLDALARTESDGRARLEATLAAAALAHGRFGDAGGAWQRLLPLLPAGERQVDQALLILAMEMKRLDELYALLEEAGRHATLVDLLQQRVGTEPSEELRVELLRRMARLLAGPLEDEAGAEQAWSRLLSLREDVEALQYMRARALQQGDMRALGDCLHRLASLEQDPNERRDLLYEYGHLLHARLGKPAEAVAVLRAVLEQLDPNFDPALDELLEACELVHDDATLAWALELVLRREREPERRVEVARRLAGLYEQSLRDGERAAAVLRAWSETAPSDVEPHHRLVALLAGSDRHAELLVELDAIAHKDENEEERVEATLRAAQVAVERLHDPDGAWARLLPLANTGNERAEALLSSIAFGSGKLDQLVALYQAAERYDDLVTVLREQAELAEEPRAKADLFRRCAQLLAGPLGDEVAAAEAFREVLSISEDLEALWFLRGQVLRLDDPEELAELTGRLAAVVADPEQRRDLLFERALLLADRLERSEEAAAVLHAVLQVDPAFVPAIEELIAVAETRGDFAGLAFALERQLALARTPAQRADIASRLADLCEDKLQDPERAMAALHAYREAAPHSPEPLRRLRPQLTKTRKWPELLEVLDQLGEYETTADARSEAALAAADLALKRLSDPQGAWERLTPLVLSGDQEAERTAHKLAAKAGLERPLANLYVLRAQSARADLAAPDWIQAATLFEEKLDDAEGALEASLRALALDLGDHSLLDRIDRLAVATGAWDRLWRVYNRLVQNTEATAGQRELLCRHAELIERHAGDKSAALDRWLEACRLDPKDDALLEHAEKLAAAAGSHADLVWIQERLYKNAQTDEQRARHLLRAARVADLGVKDREQALRNMARALALSENLPAVAREIEELARELDRARPELGRDDARRHLVQAHMELAQSAGERFGAVLVLRASQLLQGELGDASAGFDALKQGATMFPNDLDLYDALERVAIKIKRLDALDAHLARCEQRASDPQVKRAVLERRGRLLGEHLQRPAKAADVYRELIALQPDDTAAFEALLRSLRQAGRYQDLLKAYGERIADTLDPQERLRLLREMAKVWEVELKNRPGAIEVWHEVKAIAPDDEEATAALSRLQG
jgi:tetratricopeptide (TPR) repeat protein